MRTPRLLLEGLVAFAAKRGWQVLHFSPPSGAGPEYLRRIKDSWDAVGIVEDCGVERSVPLPDGNLGVPFVCIDIDPAKAKSLVSGKGPRRIGFVNADSDLFAEIAAKELLRHDFTSYAYVSAYHRRHWSERRREVFRRAVEDVGGDFRSFDGARQYTGDSEVSRRLGKWLEALPKPCGLLAANDRIADLVISVANRHGIDIPDMLSVIGIDNDEVLCESMMPSLTSVQADFPRGGYLAGQLLAEMIDGRPAEPKFLTYGAQKLVQRLSTRRLMRQAPSVRSALDFIRRHAAEGISASDVLPILGGSRRHAEMRFKAGTGKSILEEIIDVRFEKLVELLERRHIPLGMLAGMTGFTSENQLQRQFKARYGTTLSDYRKRLCRNLP
jgi:LacI family transcriptional regulator